MIKKALILFAVFLLPTVAYIYLQTGHNQYHFPEKFGPKTPVTKTVDGKTVVDTVYHTVGGFSLLGTDSLPVTDAVAKGKIHVAEFFFASCQTICPKMSAQMMRIQHEFANDSSIVLLSFTVDPKHDTPSVLKGYAAEHQAKPGKWFFMTGDKEQIYKLARESYFLPVSPGDGSDRDFIHSEQLVLVDREGHIRAYCDGTDFFEVKKLLGIIRLLKVEEAEIDGKPHPRID